MRNYLAVWSGVNFALRRQEITMTFWARNDTDARRMAARWFDRVEPVDFACDFTLNDLSAERIA